MKDTPGRTREDHATGGGEKSVYETDIEIRSVRRPQIKVTPVTLEAGKSWKGTVGLPGVEVRTPLCSKCRMSNLSTSPRGCPTCWATRMGCVEQITSKAFPQLYLSGFASLTREQEQSTEATVKEVIRRLRSYQTVDGSFSYWPGGTAPNAWGTVYAIHFCSKRRRKVTLYPKA